MLHIHVQRYTTKIQTRKIDIFVDTKNVHNVHNTYRNPKNTKLVYETFYYLFEFKVFRHEERERHNFFLCWLFHLTPPRAAHFVDPQLLSPRRDQKSTCFVQAQISAPTHPTNVQSSGLNNVWISTNFFFQIPQILSASRHDVIHVPGPIFHLGFLLWHLWLSHPSRTRGNTCAQCVHLTNPWTKRKVLSLTKPKG